MTSDQVLYRKYRPQTFDEVLGQEQLVQALRGAIAQKKIGHAYLFAGSRGIGKTTLARIFAREIGTKDRDLVEIDAASNRGIDDVRALREEVYRSSRKRSPHSRVCWVCRLPTSRPHQTPKATPALWRWSRVCCEVLESPCAMGTLWSHRSSAHRKSRRTNCVSALRV